ncbi:hypothetical protein LCGC14_2286750, partial [marine sediment metagenome]
MTHLSTIVWPESRRWYDESPDIQAAFEHTATRVQHRDHKETWFSVMRTARRRQDVGVDKQKSVATGLQGFHETHLLFELDEASDVEDPNWDSAESSLRLPDNKILAFANPVHTVGRMWQIFNLAQYKKYWYGRAVSYLESTMVDHSLAEMQIELYGLDSDIVQVRWFGKFPGKETSDILPSFQAITGAVDRARNQDIEA